MKSLFLALALAASPVLAQSGPAEARSAGTRASDEPQKAGESIGRMRVILREVLGKLEEARKSKDVVRLNCVNEKLSQIKGLIRISEQADLNLQEAVARRDQSVSDHEQAKIGIARSKAEQLRSEAEQCIGELAYRADENLLVEVDIPDDLPLLDPTRAGDPSDVSVRTPPVTPVAPDPLQQQQPASPTL